MANEISYRGKLAYSKGDADAFDFGDLTATMAGTKAQRGRQTVTTTPENINLGEVTAAGAWFICKNMDATNNLLLQPAGASSIQVNPGETCGPFRWGPAVTAPQALSSAGSVDFIYLLVSA